MNMVIGDVLGATQRNMIDHRYITEKHDNGVRHTMIIYKEYVEEHGEPQVFHKTDKVGFKSPLVKEDYE